MIENIGYELKSVRKEAGFSQKNIAKRMNVHTKTIGRWERGEHLPQKICEEKLIKLINYLGDLIKVRNSK